MLRAADALMEQVFPHAPSLPQIWRIIRQTYEQWSNDHASRLSASLAFYTLLSIAPVIVLCLLVAGLIYGETDARGHIARELSGIVGRDASEAIATIVNHAPSPEGGIIGTSIGLIVLIFGASGVFYELRESMHAIWEVKPKPHQGALDFMRQHAAAFALVMVIALLLLTSTVLGAVLSAVGRFGTHLLPGGELLWQVFNFLVSLLVVSLLFALMYKYLAPVKLTWTEAWIGGTVAALLFVIGKSLIGLYLGKSSLSSSFGAAGSLVALLIWVYYSAQIVFFGAELTRVLYDRHHDTNRPRVPA